MAKERIDKLLSNSGYGTRKEVKALVKNGYVVVNGNIIKDSSVHADTEADEIIVCGKLLEYKKYIYIMMNKPQGVISATEDDYDRTVIDLLDDKSRSFRPAPVGRLDKDTEGLIILTNDGDLNHQLITPKKHVPKKYYARINKSVDEQDADAFEAGIVLEDGYKCLPGRLEIISSREDEAQVQVIIYEGKFHQVKRMFEALGKKVVFLKRLQMGGLSLDESLQPGQYRELTDSELGMLRGR